MHKKCTAGRNDKAKDLKVVTLISAWLHTNCMYDSVEKREIYSQLKKFVKPSYINAQSVEKRIHNTRHSVLFREIYSHVFFAQTLTFFSWNQLPNSFFTKSTFKKW